MIPFWKFATKAPDLPAIEQQLLVHVVKTAHLCFPLYICEQINLPQAKVLYYS